MACSCTKNKQNGATPAPQKPSNPINNGNVNGGRRVEKRIIR